MNRIKMAAELSGSNGASENGSGVYTPGEFGEIGEKARAILSEKSPISPNSPPPYMQKVVYPEDSIIADFVRFGRRNVESADAYIVGSILPIIGALLARRVWIEWGDGKKFANCFVMLPGKPGDRKSSIINLTETLARRLLDPKAFLPRAFSPETLFDEYSEPDGLPDKLLILDDANPLLTDFRKAMNGERLAARFLDLADCKGLSESFRRNKDEKGQGARRMIEETSTNVLFGATFNAACFQGQAVRAGLDRRFLYYVAEDHGRLIVRPPRKDFTGLEALAKDFGELLTISGPMDFAPGRAFLLWEKYQNANRADRSHADPMQEAKLGRLSSAPWQTLSIAMIFEAARWAKAPFFEGARPWLGTIEESTLSQAIEHVNGCLEAAEFLDSIANKAEIAQQAEVLLANVRRDFLLPDRIYPDFVLANRTELTRQYCAHSSRARSWKPDDLYLRLIPHLERQGEAFRVPTEGKREWFAFRRE